jgi:hypothetical protein
MKVETSTRHIILRPSHCKLLRQLEGIVLVFIVCNTIVIAKDSPGILQELETAVSKAIQQEYPLLAPAAFQRAKQLYEEADAGLRKNEPEARIRARTAEAMRALTEAGRVAENVRRSLAEALASREASRKLDPSMAQRLTRAEQLLAEAAAKTEAGYTPEADRLSREASLEYRNAGATFLREVKLAEVRRELDSLRGRLPEGDLDRAERTFKSASESLRDLSGLNLAELARIIDGIVKIIYPRFFWEPPMTLQMGEFTLYVESYEVRRWDFQNQVIIGASGTAWLSFECSQRIIFPYAGLSTLLRTMTVVESVRDDTREISIADARRIDPSQVIGSRMQVRVPAYATTGIQIADALRDLVAVRYQPKGDIKVRFENLTIRPGGTPTTGIVTAGTANYPTIPPVPEHATLQIAGFTLYINKLTLTPNSATANAELEMPNSIVDPGTGHPGRISLGDFAISSDCQFRRELPALTFGAWSVGNTEMLIRGTGVVADFDKSWAAPGLGTGSDAAAPAWRGVILDRGATMAAASPIISNSGYLRAQYKFSKAEISDAGLKGNFVLDAPFDFTSLQPVGYAVRISRGFIDLLGSAVSAGEFQNDRLAAPKAAAEAPGGGLVEAEYAQISVNANLDLQGFVKPPAAIEWGEYNKIAGRPTFYRAEEMQYARFYLSGTYKTSYFPLDGSGSFVEPIALISNLPAIGIQGLSVFFPKRFVIFTPDTPGQKPLVFRAFGQDDRAKANWLNISFGGVHGRMSEMFAERATNTDLGPIEKPFYVGREPFRDNKENHYRINIKYVSSAVYDCDMRGTLHLPMPVQSDMDFTNMVFTSTAQNAGAKVPFNNPLKLSYWGLDMVKKPGASSAGVISVRTGQVLFTAAGIRERRHFASPFYLTWGEMLANGSLRRLIFDYNSAGQKFDRFHYTASFVRLSDYNPASPGDPAFLKVAGTAHIDFFGAKYINLNDFYDPSKPGDPWNGRVVKLMSDAQPNSFSATDPILARTWSDNLGTLNFKYNYDDNLQDGFVGTGQMSFQEVSGSLASSIVVKAERICMSASESVRHDFKLGPAAHFGSMKRITGCGCIENGQLERVMLSAELEGDADVNALLRSAAYGSVEWLLTPSITQLEIQGDLFLSLLSGNGIEVQGHARFTSDRSQDFVEGEIDGKFDTSSALGTSSVTADGQLNWHLGKVGGSSYQSIQGRLAVNVVSSLVGGSAEGGFYIGINAPKSEAWVLATGGDKFKLDTGPLPQRLTGVYGYAKLSRSINVYVFSGGIEAYAGLGGFVANIPGAPTGVALPYVVGNVGVHIWGDILGGFVSADGWADLNVIAPYPFSFRGTLGLEGCVLWVACKSVDVSVGLNSSNGLFVE